MQYYVLNLTTFQSGIDSVLTSAGSMLSLTVYNRFLIAYNWRSVQVAVNVTAALFNFLWIPCYYNVMHLQSGWYALYLNMQEVSESEPIRQLLFQS